MNRVTINFVECDPMPSRGYRLFWRVAGSADSYTYAGNYFSTPAVFTDSNLPGTEYEGTLTSQLRDSICDPVFWSTIEDSGSGGSGSGSTGEGDFSLLNDDEGNSHMTMVYPEEFYSLAYGSFPITAGAFASGSMDTGIATQVSVQISRAESYELFLELKRNGIVIQSLSVIASGTYYFSPVPFLVTDNMYITLRL